MKKKLKILLLILLVVYVAGSVAATHIIYSLLFVRVEPQTAGPLPL